jgi:2-oxoglutarate ferredoxin oxidoreductase subunit beta
MAKIKPLSTIVEQYINIDQLPTQFCPGCGTGIIMGAIARAIDNTKINPDKVALVVGIGCYGFSTGRCFNFNEVHCTHGRTPAFATGLKLVRPDLTVIVIMGDGDCLAIGGNHLIHAARRNIGLTALLVNNGVYGMTGGQSAPTTPLNDFCTSTPYGAIERPFDPCRLAEAAGATFVARSTTYFTTELTGFIGRAIMHKGFSLIDIITQCPVSSGRRNPQRGKDAVAMLQWQRDNSISLEKAKKMKPQELKGKIIRGVFVEEQKPEFSDLSWGLLQRAKKEV